MSDWKKDDRVTLAERPEFVGVVTETPRPGQSVEIALDGGGHGRFKASDLVRAEDAPVTNKTWPPAGIETKTPT